MDSSRWLELLRLLEIDLAAPGSGERNDAAWALLAAEVRRLSDVLVRQFGPEWALDADDVAQDVLIKLHAHAAVRKLQAARSPEGYLVVVIRNRILDVLRTSESFRREKATSTWLDEEYSSAPPAVVEERIALQRLMEELSDDELELLRMRFWEDLSIQDIAERLEIRYSAASQRLFRLLGRLRGRLQS